MSRNEADWEKMVLVCVIILAVIAFFKLIFWLCVASAVIGIVWLLINLSSSDHDYSHIAIIMVMGGLALGLISYQIGYGFEKSELGKPIVDSARTVVEMDNTITEIQQNATNQLIIAANQIVQETGAGT